MTRRVKNKQNDKIQTFLRVLHTEVSFASSLFRASGVSSCGADGACRGEDGGAWSQSTYINLSYRRVAPEALGAGGGGVSGKSPNCTFSSGKAYAQISCC